MKSYPNTDSIRQLALVETLADPACYPHPAAPVVRMETHISHILLAGEFVYKIKKSLNLGFLDFTSLDRRKTYCTEEVRLNRRLAPDLYLDCIPICGSVDRPVLGGDPAAAIEYAVKMRRFPQQALLDRVLTRGVVEPRHIDALAWQLADFHGAIAVADGATRFGTPSQVQAPVLENFRQCRPLLTEPADLETLSALERWSAAAYERLQPILTARKEGGFIRECHGDLHLGNMILEGDRIIIFDCIEFNDDFRWIDTMSDLAFLIMDLHRRGAQTLAWRLLNRYLEFSGDYEGLQVLSYYQVYRAMVRAKIAAIRRHQPGLGGAEQAETARDCRAYLDLALSFAQAEPAFLVITHGPSGSGKSYLSAALLETLGAVRIRSDVERKRLFGLGPLAGSGSAIDQGLYTAEAGTRTYERLRNLAGVILDAGYRVLVDATFLERQRRQEFRDLAGQRGVPFLLLACKANPGILRTRVAQRQARGDDAAEADVTVLERQLRGYTPPAESEQPLYADGEDIAGLERAIRQRLRLPAHCPPIGSP